MWQQTHTGGRERENFSWNLWDGARGDSRDSLPQLQMAVRQNICANPKPYFWKPHFQVSLRPQMVRWHLTVNVHILIHYQWLDYRLSLKSIMDINTCRGWSLHTEFWPLLLSFCTEKQMAHLMYQPTHWNSALAPTEITSWVRYRFLVPVAVFKSLECCNEKKIVESLGEAGRSSSPLTD